MPSGSSGMPCGGLCVLRFIDILATWSFVHIFKWDSTVFSTPRKLGHHPTLTKNIICLVFFPPQVKLRFKVLNASSLL